MVEDLHHLVLVREWELRVGSRSGPQLLAEGGASPDAASLGRAPVVPARDYSRSLAKDERVSTPVLGRAKLGMRKRFR